MPAVAVVVFAISLPLRPTGAADNLDPVANLRSAVEAARDLADVGRRTATMEAGRAGMKAIYGLTPAELGALRGHSVAVEPWEISAVWAYRLDWKPLPVFQNYSAYTPALDRRNSEAVEDPGGPERLLRENQLLVDAEFPTADLDDRFGGWDPPEQARAVLCNFVPLAGDERWQVLGRVPDRCGEPRQVGTASAAAGEPVDVPVPGRGEVVFVRIGGAGVSGLETLQTFLFHADSRHATVNGSTRYRLVPETAGDGLLLRAAPGIVRTGAVRSRPRSRNPRRRRRFLEGDLRLLRDAGRPLAWKAGATRWRSSSRSSSPRWSASSRSSRSGPTTSCSTPAAGARSAAGCWKASRCATGSRPSSAKNCPPRPNRSCWPRGKTERPPK